MIVFYIEKSSPDEAGFCESVNEHEFCESVDEQLYGHYLIAPYDLRLRALESALGIRKGEINCWIAKTSKNGKA